MVSPKKEFVLTHVFEKVSSMEGEVRQYTPIEKRFEVPWRISAVRHADHLGLYFYCLQEKKDEEWSIEAWREMKICGAKGKTLSRNVEYTYGSTSEFTGYGWSTFVPWEEMMKDYVIDDTLRVELHVKINKMTGIEAKKNLMNFDESRKQFSDVVLVVENQKFYVLKLYLASQSTYFEALFLRNFKESNQSEIPLEDVNAEDFQNFLELLHLESPLDESTIDGILHLADMYDAKLAIRKCEQFLIENSKKTLKEKLQLADEYTLGKLKDACLSKINTVTDIRSALTDDPSEMDPSVVAALLLKLLALQDK